MDIDLAKKKWRNHVNCAKERGRKGLTFEQYKDKLIEAGITPEQVGRSLDNYSLARRTDQGDYTVESCRFITTRENLQEKRINGGIERMAAKNRGKTKENDPGRAKSAAARKGRTAATHEHIAIAAAKSSAARKGRKKEDYPYIAAQAERLAKPYSFLSPDGVVHLGKNLCEFCRTMNLSQSLMTAVREGRQRHHKGWTLHEPAAPTGPAQPDGEQQ